MSRCLVLCPTLDRPHLYADLARNVRDSDRDVELLFLCSPGYEHAASAAEGCAWTITVPWEPGGGADWTKKSNLGYELARNAGFEWVLLGADDLRFHPGWFEACLRVNAATGACVIGTNDMGNPRVKAGEHATHPLVHRDYIDCGGALDDPSKLLPVVYGHCFVDDETVGVAKARGSYAHAHDARVEHCHPNWAKGRDDETYRRGQATFDADRALFQSRRHLWEPPAAERSHLSS